MLKSKSIKVFLIVYAGFILLGTLVIMMFSKGELVLWINENSSPAFDSFFKIVTLLGTGYFFAIPVLIALFIHYDYAITGVFALLVTALFSYLFKQVLFHGMPRPTSFFTNGELTHFIQGFDYHSSNSFPSGHSMSVFALMLFICLLINKKWVGILTFIIALLTGISRIYLLQHFFVDVFVGSVLGVLGFLIAYWMGCKWLGRRFSRLQNRIKSGVFSGNTMG